MKLNVRKIMQVLLTGCCVLLGVCITLHYYRRNEVRLELNCREAEVEQYSSFDALAYVKEMSTAEAVVELPCVDTSVPGEQIAVYRIEGWGKKVERALRVRVIEKKN
jgi:hypothetical protein